MTIEDLKQILSDSFEIENYGEYWVINNHFFCPIFDNQDMPINVFVKNGEIVLSDMGLTYKSLQEIGIDLEQKDLFDYLNKILFTLSLNYDKEEHTLFVTTKNKSQISLLYSKLLQAIILLSYVDLQCE